MCLLRPLINDDKPLVNKHYQLEVGRCRSLSSQMHDYQPVLWTNLQLTSPNLYEICMRKRSAAQVFRRLLPLFVGRFGIFLPDLQLATEQEEPDWRLGTLWDSSLMHPACPRCIEILLLQPVVEQTLHWTHGRCFSPMHVLRANASTEACFLVFVQTRKGALNSIAVLKNWELGMGLVWSHTHDLSLTAIIFLISNTYICRF